jgi:membrane associated rhomboid family serine protease
VGNDGVFYDAPMALPAAQPNGSLAGRGAITLRRARFWSATKWLIVINVVVFVCDAMLRGRLTQCGAFSIMEGVYHLQVWRVVTCQFLHAGPGHLFFNMLWLYYLGVMLEARLGRRRFISLYLVSGSAGPLAFMLLWRMQVLSDVSTWTYLVGASGGIFGVMAAAARVAPGTMIRLWLPPVSLTLRMLTLILVGLAVLTIWTGGWNAGGEAAHVAGAVTGYALMGRPHMLHMLSGRRRKRFWRPGDPATNFFRNDVR